MNHQDWLGYRSSRLRHTSLAGCLLVCTAVFTFPTPANADALEPQKLEYCRPYQGPLVPVEPLLKAINDQAFTRDVARDIDVALQFRKRQAAVLESIERELMKEFRDRFNEIERVKVTEWNVASVKEKQPGSRLYGLNHSRLPNGLQLEETQGGVLVTNAADREHFLVGPTSVFYPGDSFKLVFRLPRPVGGPSHFPCSPSLLNHEGRARNLYRVASSDKVHEVCVYVTADKYLMITNGKLSRVPTVSLRGPLRGSNRPAPVRLMFALWPKAQIEIAEFYRSPVVAQAADAVPPPEASVFRPTHIKPAKDRVDP